MKYIWTEDTGAGLHYWECVNQYLLNSEYKVETKHSNQGLLDAAREIDSLNNDQYFLAFDIVYDNMDIMNKFLDLREIAASSNGKIVLIDTTCFEYTVLAFKHLINWTETGRKDKIQIRECILQAMREHRIDIDQIEDERTLNYLKGFKRFSTERIMKSLVHELTDQKHWGLKGKKMGECWHQDCCIAVPQEKCGIHGMTGKEKMDIFLHDTESARLCSIFH